MSGKVSQGTGSLKSTPKKATMGPFLEFVDSDSPIAAFVFFILMAIVFAILLSLGIKLISAIFGTNENPYLFTGMRSAENALIIDQDPSVSGSIPIVRSTDQPDGLEFTWSIWMYINDLQYGYGKFKHVFHKGNANFQWTGSSSTPSNNCIDDLGYGCCAGGVLAKQDSQGSNCKITGSSTVEGMSNGTNCEDTTYGCCNDNTTAKTDGTGSDCPGYDTTTGLNFPNNAPGLYIAPTTNDLVVVMNTFTTINEQVTIPDIPLNKWVNVIIRVEGDTLDVYINGGLDRRHQLGGVPKQNYGDVYVTMNGGFNGYVSCLRYFDKALQPGDIQQILHKGPCLAQDEDKKLEWMPPYLSLRWYFQGPEGKAEMANPPGYDP